MEEEKKKPIEEEETLDNPIKEEEEEKVTEFNAEEEVNALKENITSFEQRLASIEGALDKFAEEEEEKPVEEETFENEEEDKEKSEFENDEEKDKEKLKEKTATYSKDIKTLLNKISNLETQIAKFGNSGMKRTSQSGVNINSGVDTELEAYNRRKGYY